MKGILCSICRTFTGRVTTNRLIIWFAMFTLVFLVLLESFFRVDKKDSPRGADEIYASSRKSLGLSQWGHKSRKNILQANSVDGIEVESVAGPNQSPPSLLRWSRTTHGPEGNSAASQHSQKGRHIAGNHNSKNQWDNLAFMTKLPPKVLSPVLGNVKWQNLANRIRKSQQYLKSQVSTGLHGGGGGLQGLGLHRFRVINTPDRMLEFQELPVSRSTEPTRGHPWPYPQFYHHNASTVHVIDMESTEFKITSTTCDVLHKGLQRQKRYFRELVQKMKNGTKRHLAAGWRALKAVKVTVLFKCDDYPRLNSEESYDLYIKDNTLFLRAPEVWGILLGLQTLTQVVVSSKGHLIIKDIRISDFPRFKHRGIMLDTARHYLSKEILLKNLDAMAANKLNVFHWHIVDDQSFPYQSSAFPRMSLMGAYTASSVYTAMDIKEVVEHARLRGIRVIPELDTPGHVQSWVGLPEVLTPCGGVRNYGPVDPTRNATYEKIPKLFEEILSLFPAGTLHMGGDECSYYCWAHNKNVTKFMKDHRMSDDFKALFSYYFTRLQKAMRERLRDELHTSVYWQEVFDENVKVLEALAKCWFAIRVYLIPNYKLSNNSIIQVWKDDHTSKMMEVTRAGHRVLLSSCWYLNYISYGSDWHKYYTCDPHQFSGTLQQKALVLGGEACMWGEFVDDSNLLTELWPRASAVAERLWSPQIVSNPYIAEARFEENRCRMIRSGIPAKAIGGPGPPCKDFWDT